MRFPQKKKVGTFQRVEVVTYEYDYYSDGAISSPRIIKSYSFVPNSKKDKSKNKKKVTKPKMVEEEVGEM